MRRRQTLIASSVVAMGLALLTSALADAAPTSRATRSRSTKIASRSKAVPPVATPVAVTSAPPAAPASAPPPARAVAASSSPSDALLAPSDHDAPTDSTPVVRRRYGISLSPLSMVFGRYGVGGEALVAPHHALTACAYVQTFPSWLIRALLPSMPEGTSVVGSPAPAVGGELGYRLYSASSDASGLFIGPSAVLMPIVYPRVTESAEVELATLHAWGGAIDVGVQHVTSSGFTVGGGVGVMALAYAPPASAAPPPGMAAPSFAEPHVLPRLLLSGGWTF